MITLIDERIIIGKGELLPNDVPNDLTNFYIEGFSLRGDWSKKEMLNANVIGCDLDGWAPPGKIAPVGKTFNHSLYMRFNTSIEGIVLPEYIPWDNHELVQALFIQKGVPSKLEDKLDVELVRDGLTNYRNSYETFYGDIGKERISKVTDYTFAEHPELMVHANKMFSMNRPGKDLISDHSINIGKGLRIDIAFILSLNLPHTHDRYDLERYLEAYLNGLNYTIPLAENGVLVEDKPVVHVWSVLPLKLRVWASYDPLWWVGKFGG